MGVYAKIVGQWLQELVDGTSKVEEVVLSRLRPGAAASTTDRERSGYSQNVRRGSNAGDPADGRPGSPKEVPDSDGAAADRRRSSLTTTKSMILRCAIKHFTASGYETVGLRAIAAEAGVDVALVVRHFGSKRDLFLAVVRELMNPRSLTGGDRATFGARIANAIYGIGPIDPSLMNIFLILRSAMSPLALPVVREIGSEHFVKPIIQWLGGENAEIRANCIFFALYGSVQSRLLDREADMASALSRMSQRNLAIGLQAIVDDMWRISL